MGGESTWSVALPPSTACLRVWARAVASNLGLFDLNSWVWVVAICVREIPSEKMDQLTISAINPSSGFGSAMSTWMVVSTVERFTAVRDSRSVKWSKTCARQFLTWLPVSLWWHIESVETYSSPRIYIWMVDRGDEADLSIFRKNRITCSARQAKTIRVSTLGGSKGYLLGTSISNLNVPPSYGVPAGPWITVVNLQNSFEQKSFRRIHTWFQHVDCSFLRPSWNSWRRLHFQLSELLVQSCQTCWVHDNL